MLYITFVTILSILLIICLLVSLCYFVDEDDKRLGCFFAAYAILLALTAAFVVDRHTANVAPSVVQTAERPIEKPLGTQAEYRIIFDEDLDSAVTAPQWVFQKYHKGHWKSIRKSTDKGLVLEYGKTYIKNVQANSQVITVSKELKPVLSDTTVESFSTIEVQE